MIRPFQWNVYKGRAGKYGAAQFRLQPAYIKCSNNRCNIKNYNSNELLCSCVDVTAEEHPGNIFLDITSTSPDGTYDWSKKIIFSLDLADMAAVSTGITLENPVSLIHDPFMGSDKQGMVRKTLNLTFPQGVTKGGILNVSENDKNKDIAKSHTVPLSAAELNTLNILLKSAISRSLGW